MAFKSPHRMIQARRRMMDDGVLGNLSRIFKFDPALVTFTPGMAKRTSAGPFETAPIVQGKWDGTGTPDNILFGQGSQISRDWYANFDPYQGSLICWFTPEWDGNDGKIHYIFNNVTANGLTVYKHSDNNLYLSVGGQSVNASAAAWTAGTTYFLVFRWDTKKSIDGTNYLCVSINDVHTYGGTAAPNVIAPAATLYIGHTGSTYAADGIIEGLACIRRVIFDGTYGVAANWDDSGAIDEINEMYS